MTGPEQPALVAIERPALDEVLAAATQLVDDAPAAATADADEVEPETGGELGPPVPPPAEWVAAVRALIDEHPHLPPLLDGDPAAAGSMYGRWVLHPWEMFADLATLLAWAGYLDGQLAVWRAGPDGPLYVYGLIAGYPTALIGHSSTLPRAVRELDVALLEARRTDEERRWDWARLSAVAS